MSTFMRRPHATSVEDRVRESLRINALLKAKKIKQKDLAEMLGYKPDAIGQWFHPVRPTPIPDCPYIHAAAILGFDPTDTRPWLKEMYESLKKIFGSQSEAPSTLLVLQTLMASLSDKDRTELLNSFQKDTE